MKIRSLLAVMLLAVGTMSAQEYLQMIDEGTFTVQEIVDNAEAYFSDKDKGRGSGYFSFKRWEYMAKRQMNEAGYLTPITEKIAELERYNAYLNETAGTRTPSNDNWQELGPTYWDATTSWNPGVGRITGIAVDASNNDHIIVSANTGGVWKTTDGGANWTQLGDYFSNLRAYSVAIDPTNSDTYFWGSSSGLIYKSTDAGGTWNLLADISNSLINRILINPDDTSIIYACSQNAGIFRSSDAGVTWTEVGGDSRGYDVEFKPGDTNTVYISGVNFHKSTDGGLTFTTVTVGNTEAKMIGVSPDDPNIVYVVKADGGQFGGFYYSDDSGDSFIERNHAGRNYFGYDPNGFDPGGQAPRDMDIVVNPNDVNEVHIAGIMTWRSTNAGVDFSCTSHWVPGTAQNLNIGYCHADVDILLFENSTLFAGTDGGIFKAANTSMVDSNYYEDLTTGIGIRQFYKIGISQTPDVIVTGGSQDNGSSFYSAANGWKDWIGADGMEGFVDKTDTNIMYGTSQGGQLYRTDDGANSIVGLNEPGPGGGNWVTPFEQDPVDDNTIYVGYNSIYKSEDKGVTWSAISQNLSGNQDEMKIAPSNNAIIYTSRSAILHKTIDGGTTSWVQMTTPGAINSMAVHPTDPNRIAVAVNNGALVQVSEDGGETWQNMRLNLPNFSSLAIAWDDNGANGLYVGLDYGIYYINDTMQEWIPYNNNLPNVIINELEVNTADGNLYAASYGRGLWVSPLQEPILGTNDVNGSNFLSLVPNPAADEVTIGLDRAIEADIRVFDVSGKLMMYLPNQLLERNHVLDVSVLNSGIYFIRINSALGTATKRLIKE
ncbi:MAG: T9SS type A sorting domain-containing protein [Flavobacteriaceae bacterium]|nr:T9SS type A sorting domain-containing protein [Flavobacteriaceae bacterium]